MNVTFTLNRRETLKDQWFVFTYCIGFIYFLNLFIICCCVKITNDLDVSFTDLESVKIAKYVAKLTSVTGILYVLPYISCSGNFRQTRFFAECRQDTWLQLHISEFSGSSRFISLISFPRTRFKPIIAPVLLALHRCETY